MKQNKINVFLLVTSILSTFILLIGATFSYFSTRNMSKMNALSVEAGKVRLGLGVSPLYTGYKLIPTNDSDIMTAYNQQCLDDYGYGACLAYEFEVYNFNLKQDVIGKIDFNVEGIENLSYMVLDENDDVYVDVTHISVSNSSGLSLGNPFTLEKGNSSGDTSKKFTLLIWLTDNNQVQDETDADKSFSADVTYRTSVGGRLTASVDGKKSSDNENLSIS